VPEAESRLRRSESAQYGNAEVPLPVFYVLEIYQDTFRHEKPVVEIHTAEPLSPISVGDCLYEVSFPDPLSVPRGHILQVAAKQHVISTPARDQVTHITKVCVKAVPTPDHSETRPHSGDSQKRFLGFVPSMLRTTRDQLP
jgi:hypothetical protein